jgi:hypothetical protein
MSLAPDGSAHAHTVSLFDTGKGRFKLVGVEGCAQGKKRRIKWDGGSRLPSCLHEPRSGRQRPRADGFIVRARE